MTDEQYEQLIQEAIEKAQREPLSGHYETWPNGRVWWVPDTSLTESQMRERKALYGRIKEGLE